jgi:prepilin-type N-terminal cleavage/methylation domain-containing protein/prepilin-type processing-associated H-X9-DG protein
MIRDLKLRKEQKMPFSGFRKFIHSLTRNNSGGFTLIEILIVIALIALLSAMLFPVFLQVQGKARQTSCASNLQQIGMAIALYAADYDDLYPYGADPSDKYTQIWGVDPTKDAILRNMPLLPTVLKPYIREERVWSCSSDTGLQDVEWSFLETDERRKGVSPSLFKVFGSSYFYRTELAFRQKFHGTSVFEAEPSNKEHGSADLVVLNDASGRWHGGLDIEEQRYNTLFGDGHVKLQTLIENRHSWQLELR